MTEPASDTLVCVNHPDRVTYLRCNKCGDPICTSCAVLTPIGYRCKNCVRGQQKVFETAAALDPYLAGGIALVLAFLGSFIVPVMQFFTIFIAPIVGMIAAEIIRRAVNRRRSRLLFQLSAAGAAAGGVPLLAMHLISLVGAFAAFGAPAAALILPVVWQGVYIFLVASTVYYRLSGIRL